MCHSQSEEEKRMRKKQMKKIVAAILLGMMFVTGCEKKVTCDFCDEKKVCVTKDVFGEKVNICEDCLSELSE